MKKLLSLGLLLSTSVCAEVHSAKEVSLLHSGDTRGCYFFSLKDVPLADSDFPAGTKWISVPHTHEASEEIFSMLLAAKLSGSTVRVTTHDSASCNGHVQAVNVVM